MEVDHDVINVCVYHYTDSAEKVADMIEQVHDITIPDFLENRQTTLDFNDLKNSELTMSTGGFTAATETKLRSDDLIQIEVLSEEDTDEEFAIHTHMTGNNHKSAMWELYSEVLGTVDEKELAVLSTGDILDTDIEKLGLSEVAMSGVHEDAVLDSVRFSIGECTIGVSEYFGGVLVEAYEDADGEKITRSELLKRINSFPDIDIEEVVG